MSTLKPSKHFNLCYQVLMTLLLLGAVQVTATQVVAWRFAYHPALGEPLVGRLYAPWQWAVWSWHWYNRYPDFFDGVYASVALATLLVFALEVVVLVLCRRRARPVADLHGSAHWASADEIRQTGLLPPEPGFRARCWPGKRQPGQGVYVGGWKDRKGRKHYLRDNGPAHVLALAPTRSGKGVGLVLPTLLSWLYSVVILDIKGENWALTAGWRKAHAVFDCKLVARYMLETIFELPLSHDYRWPTEVHRVAA